MKLNKGRSYMVIDKNTGDMTGWHTMEKDNTAKVEWKPRIWQTVYIVTSGPDKGWYATPNS